MDRNTFSSASSDRSPLGVQNLRNEGGKNIGLRWRFQSPCGGNFIGPATAIETPMAESGVRI
jgi:hypothetical protein